MTAPKEEAPKEEPPAEFDPYDEEKFDKYIEDRVARKIQEREKAKAEAARKEKAEADRLKMVAGFIENHKDLGKSELEAVAVFARDHQIYDMEHAFLVMNADKSKLIDEPAPDKDLGKKVEELPVTLTDVGGGGKKDRGAEGMSQGEFENLSSEAREELLRNA